MSKKVEKYYYKQIRPYDEIIFNKVVDKFEWNINTANFEKVKKDIQAEIDSYKGQDLKSLIEKNIYPIKGDGQFIDTTAYAGVSIHDLHNALNTELIVDENEKDKKDIIKNDVKNEISNSKDPAISSESGN